MSGPGNTVRAIEWTATSVRLLDQRLLPDAESWCECHGVEAVADAIAAMVVRGAPAIGIAAAYGFALAMRAGADPDASARRLTAARPTAVNLAWAVERMREHARRDPDPVASARAAEAIHGEDIVANQRIGEFGAEHVGAARGVITHCNTGALATGGYGTALGVIRSLWARGALETVYACETRPWLQGARLTAWELARESIPAAVICDSAAGARMQAGGIDAVIVGADRVAANGDVANKIGTYALAVLARHHGIPFIVAAPRSTVDMATARGADIPIETRDADELLVCGGRRTAPPGARAWNPVFDITPAALVSALVTEAGVAAPPGPDSLRALAADSAVA